MSKKENLAYKQIIKKYPDLSLPQSFIGFKKLFPNHAKFDKDSFLFDLTNTIVQELSGRLDFIFYRLYPGEIAILNNERNFLREKIGTEKLFKFYIDIRTVQLGVLNSLDKVRLDGDEKILSEAVSDALKFFKEVVCKKFLELSNVIIEGWHRKFHEKREREHPSYIR